MAELKENPSLSDLQEYLKNVAQERGWTKSSDLELFLLLSEEVGELAKAIRNRRGLFREEGKKYPPEELEAEMADVLSYLLDLANHFNIDLETAFRSKEKKNAQRAWS
ncbi:MAG: MazG nucleotide pyrophosphohydrolase domain-containing protein [Bacteroidota bacterium]